MLRLEALSRRFGFTAAVSELSLQAEQGEIISLVGPSGCGKTTTLRMIAGFESPSSGRVWLDGRDVTHLPPQQRRVGMIFQNYALFPHLNVHDNVAFGLQAHGHPRADIAQRVEKALALVELAGYGGRRVQDLSGGQQQRVAVARALAPEPPVLLLDEPLSNLDVALRERTRAELRTLLKGLGITAVFVTHDQEEAFALADRIALLRDGVLQQVGTPESLYEQPVNPFVAGFVGRANLLAARVQDGVARLAAGAEWPVRGQVQGEARVMVRPEALRFVPPGTAPHPGDLAGSVSERRFAGAASFYTVQTEQGSLLVQEGSAAAGIAERVRVRPKLDAVILAFPAAAA